MEEIKGISFPFRIGGRGGIIMSGDGISEQEHIQDCIKVLLGTREYERVMQPLIGLEDLEVFFDDLNETTKNMAIFKITETIHEWEPRVEVISVDIVKQDDPGGVKHIVSVMYRVLASGETASTAVSF